MTEFSDEQRELGREEIEFKGPGRPSGQKVLDQILNGFDLNGEAPNKREDVAISTRFGVSFLSWDEIMDGPGGGQMPGGNYFLPVLDLTCTADVFHARILGLFRNKAQMGIKDPMLEFMRKYRFTAMDTGQSLHLVGASMIPNGTAGYERSQEIFLAQALMFPSLGVDSAWVGHSLFRQWMGLRISSSKSHPTIPTLNRELTDLLRTLDQGHIGQANPVKSGVAALF